MTTFEKSGKTVNVREESERVIVEVEGKEFEAKPEIRQNGEKYVFAYTVSNPEIYKVFDKQYSGKALSITDESAADYIEESAFRNIVKESIDLNEEMIFAAIGYYYGADDIRYFNECTKQTNPSKFNQLVYADRNMPCETGGSKVRNIEKKVFNSQKELVDYVVEKSEEAKQDDLGVQWFFRTSTTK